MGRLILDADYALLQSLYPLLDLRPLTNQEEEFFHQYMRGNSIQAAADAAGLNVDRAQKIIRSETGQAILRYLHEKTMTNVRITKEVITAMLLESHRKAATATEEIMAARELGKLHDLYEEVRANRNKATGVNVVIQNNLTNIKQVERLTDEQLMQLTGGAFKGFTMISPMTPISKVDPDYDPVLDV